MKDALKYLDTRTEFWRQQKPIYARKKEQVKIYTKRDDGTTSTVPPSRAATPAALSKPSRPSSSRATPRPPQPSSEIVDSSLSAINTSLEKGDITAALRKAKALLWKIPDLHDIPEPLKLKGIHLLHIDTFNS